MKKAILILLTLFGIISNSFAAGYFTKDGVKAEIKTLCIGDVVDFLPTTFKTTPQSIKPVFTYVSKIINEVLTLSTVCSTDKGYITIDVSYDESDSIIFYFIDNKTKKDRTFVFISEGYNKIIYCEGEGLEYKAEDDDYEEK